MWEMNRFSRGYKRAVDQKLGSYGKIRLLGQKPRFLLNSSSSHDQKMLCKEKVPFSKINISSLRNVGFFFWIKCIFGQKNIFQPNVKMTVSL